MIVGATSAMAEQCARLWLQVGPADLALIGRNEQRLRRVADDLAVRSPASTITWMTTDFLCALSIDETVTTVCKPDLPDLVLIAHGSLPDQSTCQTDLRACRSALEVNGLSPVLFAEAFVAHMEPADRGVIAIIGSVAGDRGRQSNYVYGAAKGLVSRYTEGLQHRLAVSGRALKVVLIKPGPTATPMTAHLTAQGQAMASVEIVAQNIVNGILKARPVIYAPSKWGIIMMAIRHIPRIVFNRMKI